MNCYYCGNDIGEPDDGPYCPLICNICNARFSFIDCIFRYVEINFDGFSIFTILNEDHSLVMRRFLGESAYYNLKTYAECKLSDYFLANYTPAQAKEKIKKYQVFE